MTRRPILVDCDTGIDDALALAYLLAEPTVEIVGVTTVSGNTDAARAASHAGEALTPPLILRPRRDRAAPSRIGGSILSPATWQQTAAALRQGR